jgi:hypothetical protein
MRKPFLTYFLRYNYPTSSHMAGILNSLQSFTLNFSLLRSPKSNPELTTVQKFSKILTEFRREPFMYHSLKGQGSYLRSESPSALWGQLNSCHWPHPGVIPFFSNFCLLFPIKKINKNPTSKQRTP